ncbi:MAG: sulfite exporter TauE/SafE family protein [Calditrichae bacterium]|nr:sulfite exporter TauE/SafE family protein [Calditrichota bacterium]MCB9056984.1 sulfite exporter TauE/SafE family protein [Calditrichia bacterium]
MDPLFIAAIAVTFLAYFVKGFSGFGPALILIPTLTIIYDPITAISYATIFDAIAGVILLSIVFRKVDWKFVLPITALLFTGSYFGVMFIKQIPAEKLKLLIGIVLIVFIAILLSDRENHFEFIKKTGNSFLLSAAFIAGFIGGITGISGPILVMIFKLRFVKDVFRTQLIAIFTFGGLWRLFLYNNNGIIPELPLSIFVLIGVVLIALTIGHLFQTNLDEKRFNRYISIILIIPAVNILIEVFR